MPDDATIESMGRAHARLIGDLRVLGEAARPLSRESLDAFRPRLRTARRDLMQHFQFEEQDGYMDAVRSQEPRLEHEINLLADEHRQLLRSLDELIRNCKRAARWNERLRSAVRQWIQSVRRHEQKESRLMQDAFGSDLGAED